MVRNFLLLIIQFGFGLKNMEQISVVTDTEKLFKGAQLASKNIIEKAKRDDRTLVVSKNGKPVHVKARDL